MPRMYIAYLSTPKPILIGGKLYQCSAGTRARISAASGQAVQERAPISDEAVSGDWTGTPGSRYQLVDDYPDEAGADYIEHGVTAGGITFGFTPLSVPAGAQIYMVQVWGFGYEPVSGVNNWRARVKVGGNYYNSTETVGPDAVAWKRGVSRLATNPKTGVAWTVDDVNGVGANALEAFGIGSTDASPLFRVSSVKLQVVYSAAYSGVDYLDYDADPNTTGTYNETPDIGDTFYDNDTVEITAIVLPTEADPNQQYYVYPSQDGNIYHSAPPSWPIEVGDLINPTYVYENMQDVVTEVGDGWFTAGPVSGKLRVVYAGGENITINRGTLWQYVDVYPWVPSLVPLRYMKFNVRILSLDGELFDVAGYEQPYRKNVKMKLLLREEIPEE